MLKNAAKLSVDGKVVLTSDLSGGRTSGPRRADGRVTFGASAGGDTKVKVIFTDARITVG
ncbi:hypothetical protein [Actinoplanes sp. NPDC051494]|uniref:hypothetical protein n=1 Tax=Actinoplanes sp. NPDC051494 TaxID=3363907 RepID=UPI00378E5EEC